MSEKADRIQVKGEFSPFPNGKILTESESLASPDSPCASIRPRPQSMRGLPRINARRAIALNILPRKWSRRPPPLVETDTCVFCGASPTTIEDVLPKWIRRYLGNRATMSVLGDTVGGTTRTFKGLAYVAKAKVVCKPCNGGWMCDLETEASPILKRMFDEKFRIRLPAGPTDSRRLLAQWAIKTALMLQYVDSDPDIPLAVYHDFYATREPPAHSLIFLARHEVQETPSGVMSMSSELTPTDPAVHFQGHLYGVTFFVKNVVVQVVGYIWDVPAGIGLYLTFPQTFAIYIQRLWPAGTLLDWTPPERLDDAQLVGFAAGMTDIGTNWADERKSTP